MNNMIQMFFNRNPKLVPLQKDLLKIVGMNMKDRKKPEVTLNRSPKDLCVQMRVLS